MADYVQYDQHECGHEEIAGQKQLTKMQQNKERQDKVQQGKERQDKVQQDKEQQAKVQQEQVNES